jgi:hypothetical protein
VIAHLRADLIRLRHRRDAWIVGAAVLALFSLGFLASYQGILQNDAQIRQQMADEEQQWAIDNPGQDVPPDLAGFWQQRSEENLARRAQFAFPASVMTMLDGASTPLGAVGFLATMTLGLEFGWATIRTVLLSSPDRARLLVARLLALGGYGVILMALLLVASAILPFALPLLGSPPPASAPVEPVVVVGRLAAVAVAMALVLGLMALLAVATRNPAMPILLVLLLFLAESLVANLPLWRSAHLELLAGSTPLNSIVGLLSGAADPTLYGIGTPADSEAAVRPLWLSFGVTAAWAAAFAGVATAILRRADISE